MCCAILQAVVSNGHSKDALVSGGHGKVRWCQVSMAKMQIISHTTNVKCAHAKTLLLQLKCNASLSLVWLWKPPATSAMQRACAPHL
eukprot:357859-Chlamydomonas_euryale.AAC.16